MNSEYQHELGIVLKEKREKAQLNKTQLALMVGISRPIIREIEIGEANPTLGTLLRITQGLGVSLADVIAECERNLIDADACGQPPVPKPRASTSNTTEARYLITRL